MWLRLNKKAYHLLFGLRNPRESIYEMTRTVFYFFLNSEIPPEEIRIKTYLYHS